MVTIAVTVGDRLCATGSAIDDSDDVETPGTVHDWKVAMLSDPTEANGRDADSIGHEAHCKTARNMR